MLLADARLPTRLLAGGGPSSPDARVLRALTTPLIGQFDPDFTSIMDEVVQMARQTLVTDNKRCFAVSGLANAGLEAVLNTVAQPGDRVFITSGPTFVTSITEMARRCGLDVLTRLDSHTRLVVAPFIDPTSGKLLPVKDLASKCHAVGAIFVIDATLGLAACELRMDEWGIDVCVAGVDYAVGAPPGMSLVSYTSDVEAAMTSRADPPRTSYLDLLQLQAYWSPDRLNHHTAPTSLVYGLREALRLVLDEGLEQRWRRHNDIGQRLRAALPPGLEIDGDVPLSIVHLPSDVDEATSRRRLVDDYGVHVTPVGPRSWRVGLLGADARPESVARVGMAMAKVLAA